MWIDSADDAWVWTEEGKWDNVGNISGPPGKDGATGSKGDQGDTGPQGLPGADAESPARVIWVAESGGDFTSLSEAMASIPDNNTAATPYVIKIAPGTYTETSNVAMKNYVDVEGSGQDVTTITCDCSTSFSASGAVISAGAITAEIRHLTINNTGTSTDASVGLWTEGVTEGSFSMLHVTATAADTGGTANYGVVNKSSSPMMNNVTATATGANGNYGVYNTSSSPTMTNVTATATGGSVFGVYNTSSSPTMNNVTATATDGQFSYGVYNNDESSPSMNNVTATASFGVYNDDESSPKIRNSSITGTSRSIFNTVVLPLPATAHVADTALGGGVTGSSFTCVGVYTTDFVALGPNCLPPDPE